MKETNVFLHKFLPILGLVFFILFILLINNSFASINFSDKDINYSFPSNPYSDNRPFFISKNFEKQTLDILVTCRYTLDELKDIYNLTDDKDYKLIYSLRFTENSGVKYVFSWMLVSVNEDGSFTTVKDLSDSCGLWLNQVYILSSDKTTWVLKENKGYLGIYYALDNIIYSTINIYNNVNSNDLFLECKADMFYLSNTELTFSYPQILSQEFEHEKFNYYEAYISLDDKIWDTFSIEYVYQDEDGLPQENSPFVYYYNIFENGNYHVRLFDNSTGQYIYDDYINVTNLSFDIYYSTEKTDKPLYIYSNDFSFDSYFVYISKDRKSWKEMNLEYINYIPGEDNILNANERYWYYITENGTYYFKFVECSSEEGIGNTYYLRKEINNLIIDDYMSDYYVPTPIISLDFNEEEQCFIVKTQNILLDKALNMKCFYTTDFESTNIINWSEMDIDFYNNSFLENSQEAYFYFTIPVIGATDTDYRIAFYNYFSNTPSDIVIYEFRYDKAIDYVENELKVNLGFSIKFNILIEYFKDRFGFLTYPIEFIFNLLNKILNIEYSEPIINIPELYIPGSNTKIFNGYNYNFNTLLENQAILSIYNIYLISVDFIIVIALIVLAYKTMMEVFNK